MLRAPETTDAAVDGLPTAAELIDSEPAPQRLLAQRGLFFGPSALVPEDLYARVERGAARRERSLLHLAPGTTVTTNTYFGRFHATYWQRWTAVPDVQVEATLSGTGRVRLMASDTNKVWRIVDAQDVQDADGVPIRLTGRIDRFVDGGGMWLDISTETGELTVSDVRWTVAAPRPVPRTDVVICTFNRVDDCLNTLAALHGDQVALATVGRVQVVDQGTDPLESRDRFAELGRLRRSAALRAPGQPGRGRRVHPRPVRRHRRAGRGARRHAADGRRRAAGAGDPDPAHRVRRLHHAPDDRRRADAQPAAPGAPAHLRGEGGPGGAVVGMPMPGALREAYLLGLDERQLPINQERRVDTEYNGWWSCLIPA